MAELWTWLAVAGAGALHGLNPASGWLLAAACGVHARDSEQAHRALGPIALGQVAAMAVLASAFAFGVSIDRALMQDLAVALGVGAALWMGLRRARSPMRISASARRAGVALGSFLIASAQGAGAMLIPALVPLCAGGAAARATSTSGAIAVALAAVGAHTAAMLLTTGAVATGVCRAVALVRRPRLVPAAASAPRR
ncbi:MAG TPA: hypothetical protein VLD35_12245 [Caldimonas sp.]|nr:hypothetical protein [Caldimonas sp.]